MYTNHTKSLQYALVHVHFADAASFSQVWVSVSVLVTLIPLFYLPESPRWLLKNGKSEEFVSTMRKAARLNKVGKLDSLFIYFFFVSATEKN